MKAGFACRAEKVHVVEVQARSSPPVRVIVYDNPSCRPQRE